MHTQPQQPTATADIELRGTLSRHAEVRCKVLDHDGHTVPVLCVEMHTDTSTHMPVRAEYVYQPHNRAQADADAKALRKGKAIVVQAPLVGLKLVATNATHIALDPSAEEAATPEQFRQEALL